MGKISSFGKAYLAEILFFVVSVLCSGLSVYGAMWQTGIIAAMFILGGLVLLTYLGFEIQKLEVNFSKTLNATWFGGFALYALAMVVCIFCKFDDGRIPLYSLITFFAVALCAMFGLLCVLGWRMEKHPQEFEVKKSEPETDVED